MLMQRDEKGRVASRYEREMGEVTVQCGMFDTPHPNAEGTGLVTAVDAAMTIKGMTGCEIKSTVIV